MKRPLDPATTWPWSLSLSTSLQTCRQHREDPLQASTYECLQMNCTEEWNQLEFMKPYQTFDLWWKLRFIYPTTISRQPYSVKVGFYMQMRHLYFQVTSPSKNSKSVSSSSSWYSTVAKNLQKWTWIQYSSIVKFIFYTPNMSSNVWFPQISRWAPHWTWFYWSHVHITARNLSFPNAVFKELSLGLDTAPKTAGRLAGFPQMDVKNPTSTARLYIL